MALLSREQYDVSEPHIGLSSEHHGILQGGHFLAEKFSRKVYKTHFDAELNTLREWHKFTSNPTLISGGGPVRMAPPTFLTRTLQGKHVCRGTDVIAPVSSAEVMDQSDFALNQ
ncbi:hypothetical protein MVEN_02353200 [Mycena venus]|uniref:Uncharacterized protein n=1 Tax=Mycena venus TaxID=2733690 RepID=A0A8H6X2U2_9AGAR|nr:hypothetical protein MVEN_02353200 [Mycena venus]